MTALQTATSFCIIINLLLCIVHSTNANELLQNEEFRLSSSIWPENYKLELLVILDPLPGYERFTAPAKSWTTVNSSEPVSVITMHAINLTINENAVKVKHLISGNDIPVTSVSYREEFHFVDIALGEPTVPLQLYEIYIEFITPISGDSLNGMYQDFYEDNITGQTRYIATTLFAPFHARRAFPCFDEPSFRATYDITLGHHTDYHAMSNMEIVESRLIDNMTVDWQWDIFAQTPSISSYIIAMIVSDLAYEEGPVDGFRNVTVRVYAKPESIQSGSGTYSAKLIGDVMTYFESLFEIQYPISKLFSVALPQFFFNAMENWGLITYKEPVLLYLPNETTEAERYRINYVLSHEKGHQWFGNLVAVDWWAYVWLKEGFATYYSHWGMNHTHPELAPWANFISKVMYVAMNFDSSNATHPLENFPPTSDAVAGIYTRIPYEKGASILRMANSMFTESVFLAGIRAYVRNFAYKSAVQDDVYEQLQESLNNSPLISSLLPTTVKVIMDSWTRKAGFPVLTVSAPSSSVLQITQRKYIDGDESNPDATWWVPVYLSPRPNLTLPDQFPDAWIAQDTTSVSVNIDTDQVVLVNPWGVGYYRVLYETRSLEQIVQQLNVNHELIPPTSRSKLLNDYANFVLTGYAEAEILIRMSSYLEQELDFLVWDGLYSTLETISNLLENTPVVQGKFKEYFGHKAYKALTFLEEKYTIDELEVGANSMLRSLLLKFACEFGEQECIYRSKQLFNDWDATKKIPLSTQEAVFCTAISQDNDGKVWQQIYNILTSPEHKRRFSPTNSRLIKSLGCSIKKDRLEMLVNEIKQRTFMVQDEVEVLLKMAKTDVGTRVLLEELGSHTELVTIFQNKQDWWTFMDVISSHLASDDDAAMVFITEKIAETLPSEMRIKVEDVIYGIDKNKSGSIVNSLVQAFQNAEM